MKTASIFAFAALAIAIAIGAQTTRLAPVSNETGRSCREPSQAMTRLEMLFGTSRTNAAPVTEEEWASFLDNEITPRFPTGLTVLSGNGQWRGADGAFTKERTYILVVWHERSSLKDVEVEAIRATYKHRFGQESVMRVDSVSCVSF